MAERHIDLLHPIRRLFRRRLKECHLVNVEQKLFGFYRQNDIPGYLIPAGYFQWLEDGDTGPILEILEHNRLDIVALYFLLMHIAEVFATDGNDLEYIDDIYSLSRVYGRRKENDRVVALLGSIEADEPQVMASDIVLYQALALKRVGRFDEAVTLWQEVSSDNTREGYRANLELAKYYEHRLKDIATARKYARLAERNCPSSPAEQEQLRRRLIRLKRKLER